MGYDDEAASAKRTEICGLIAHSMADVSDVDIERVADKVADKFVEVTPPYWKPPRLERVTIEPGGRGGGTSVKPGNVKLNLRRLVVAIGTGVLTIAGTMAAPWTLLIGALVTWERLWSSAEVEITEEQACVLWAIWNLCDDRQTVAKADITAAVNRERSNHGRGLLDPREVELASKDLIRLGCIRQSKRDPGRWWLREWVKVKY